MKKEYTRLTREVFDENMEPTGETEETIFVSLIADEGKLILQKSTGIKGTRADIGTEDREENYEEIDDTERQYVEQEVVNEIVEGVKTNGEQTEPTT